MPIFFPDNDNRKMRVIQLGADAQQLLHTAEQDYKDFMALLPIVNAQIADAYKSAGLKPPGVTSVDILKASGVEGQSKAVDIAKILTGIAGLVSTVKYLIPGATKFLVNTGVMLPTTAARVLMTFTIPLIERDVIITVGDIAGAIAGGILGGIAVTGIDLGIDAIEGVIARDKLRAAIVQTFPLRAGTKLSVEKASTLLDSLRAVKTTLDAISGSGVTITDEILRNLITKSVEPSIRREQAITPSTVAADLKKEDTDDKSWTNEDPAPQLPVDPLVVGTYECHKYDSGGKNDWHYVTVSKINETELKWANRAGGHWILSTTAHADSLTVGPDCPYFEKNDHKSVAVVWENKKVTGLHGPLNELYARS